MMWFRDPSRQSRSAPGPWCTLMVSTPGWSLTASTPAMAATVADTAGGCRKKR